MNKNERDSINSRIQLNRDAAGGGDEGRVPHKVGEAKYEKKKKELASKSKALKGKKDVERSIWRGAERARKEGNETKMSAGFYKRKKEQGLA